MLGRTYGKKTIKAQRTFTDREPARKTFRRMLNEPQGPDKYRVLTYYGVGGQGKSALCRNLQGALEPREAQGELAMAKLDFESPEFRTPDRALLSLRLQLQKSGRMRFPVFDFAFARYFALTNPGVNIRQRHPELFESDNEILLDIISVAGDTLTVVPGVGLIAKYGIRLGGRFLEWWRNRGVKLLADVEELPPYKLLEELPKYLVDMHHAMFGENPLEDTASTKRIVIFMDAYEKLWESQSLKYGLGAFAVDAWVRRLVVESPGVLFILLGRDKMRWADFDSDYERVLEQHILGGLSNEDADPFLRNLSGVPRLSEPV